MKHILLIILILFCSTIIYLMSSNGIDAIETSLIWLNNGRAGVNVPYFKNYTVEHINEYEIELQTEYYKLQNIQTVLKFIILFVFAFLIWFYKEKGLKTLFKIEKNKGVTFFLFYLILIVSNISIFYFFKVNFDKFPNANKELGVITILFYIFISPIVISITYLINQKEIEYGLHNNKWISIIILFFLVPSVLILLGLFFLSRIFPFPPETL